MKKLLLLIALFALLLPAGTVLAQSQICGGSETCTTAEVGVFMQGISVECGNAGTCSLDDIMLVFANVGNYVTSIVGALVLLMYIIGGIFFLTAGGSSERISKGKQFFKFATLGLIIVMFGFVGVITLKNAITTGELACSKDADCGPRAACTEFGECISLCEKKDIADEEQAWACVDTSLPGNSNTGCVTDLCPDSSTSVLCCPASPTPPTTEAGSTSTTPTTSP